MKPEEVAKEKVRINKMSQVKLRLAIEAKNMKPKRVPGTKKDYMKQLKCQMDGLDDNVEELKACVPQWEQDRLVQEMKARKVEPAIQIAPKKTLAEQLIKIQVKEDMEEKPKKALIKKINKMSLVELIAVLEENATEPENEICKNAVLFFLSFLTFELFFL